MNIKYSNYFKQYIIFIIGGGIGLLINMVITYFLTEFLGLFYMASYSVAITTLFVVTFIYHKNVTFRKRKYGNHRFIKFIIISLLILFFSGISVYVVTELLKIHYLISIFFVALFFSVINYGLNRIIIFKK